MFRKLQNLSGCLLGFDGPLREDEELDGDARLQARSAAGLVQLEERSLKDSIDVAMLLTQISKLGAELWISNLVPFQIIVCHRLLMNRSLAFSANL